MTDDGTGGTQEPSPVPLSERKARRIAEQKTAGTYASYTQAVTDAKGGVQDAYIKAWRNLDQLEDAEKFPGWLSMIVGSTALDALRKKKELPFSALGTESEEGDEYAFEEEDWRTEYRPEHAYTEKETSELLREMLDALSDEQRFCMLMYCVEEHSVGEIAQTIGGGGYAVSRKLSSSPVQTAETGETDILNAEQLADTNSDDSRVAELMADTETTELEYDEPEPGFDRISVELSYNSDGTIRVVSPVLVKGDRSDYYEYETGWRLDEDNFGVTRYIHTFE